MQSRQPLQSSPGSLRTSASPPGSKCTSVWHEQSFSSSSSSQKPGMVSMVTGSSTSPCTPSPCFFFRACAAKADRTREVLSPARLMLSALPWRGKHAIATKARLKRIDGGGLPAVRGGGRPHEMIKTVGQKHGVLSEKARRTGWFGARTRTLKTCVRCSNLWWQLTSFPSSN